MSISQPKLYLTSLLVSKTSNPTGERTMNEGFRGPEERPNIVERETSKDFDDVYDALALLYTRRCHSHRSGATASALVAAE